MPSLSPQRPETAHNSLTSSCRCRPCKSLQQTQNLPLQAKEPGARAIPFSDVYAKSEDRPLLNLETTTMSKDTARIVNYVYCFMRFAIIAGMHVATFFVAPK